jgi:hypothetical protein
MDLQTEDFLDGADTDTVLAVVANLFAEVADLRDRVAALEGAVEGGDSGEQERFDDLASRVLSPLAADPELP